MPNTDGFIVQRGKQRRLSRATLEGFRPLVVKIIKEALASDDCKRKDRMVEIIMPYTFQKLPQQVNHAKEDGSALFEGVTFTLVTKSTNGNGQEKHS